MLISSNDARELLFARTAGIMPEDLCEKAGVPYSTLALFEGGKSLSTIAAYLSLLEAAGCKISQPKPR